MAQEVILYALIYAVSFAFGYVLGIWKGHTDAQPKRDKNGRFTKE